MRKLIFLGLMILGVKAWGAGSVFEAPFMSCTDVTSVALTTYSWTAVPSSNCAGRVGFFLDVPSTNTGDFRGIWTNSSTTPTSSTNTWVMEISASADTSYLGAASGVYLWGYTSHTAAENVVVQEIKQQ